MSTSLCISTEPVIFTRYLYNKVEVKQALFISLLNKNLDEAMFWAYELYFSGFGTDVFDYIINVYREIYSTLNPKLIFFIEKMLIEWADDKSKDWTIGSIITTLVHRDYDINNFVSTYFNVVCHPKEVNKTKRKLKITLSNDDINKYRTITDGKADNILEKACKYGVYKEYNKLFDTGVPERKVLKDIYYYHWLYYCLDTPVWRHRIFDYKGKLNHEKKTIEFDCEENLQEFYDNWGYYPDEQYTSVACKSIGNYIEPKSLTIMDFCQLYNATPITKKIKKEKTDTKLINSIAYT